MGVFSIASYAFDAAALPYLAAGLLAFGIGAGLLLYERFTPASRRFFAVAAVFSVWLVSYGLSYMATEASLAQLWYRLGLAMTSVGVPLVYGLALHLTGRGGAVARRALWAAAAVMVALAAGPLTAGIRELLTGTPFQGWGPVALVYVAYITLALLLVLREFWRGYRGARSRSEKRRHLTMLLAIAVSSLGLADFFVPSRLTFPSGITPLAMLGALALMGVAGTRYRTFGLSTQFATDEVLRAMADALLVCDDRGRVRVANSEAQRLLEVPGSTLVGSHVGHWLRQKGGEPGPVRAGEPLTAVALVRDRGLTLQPEEGPPVDVSVSIEPIMEGGERRGLVIVARDIRDRLHSDRALRAAERRYTSLFWHNPGAAYETDLEGRFLQINPAAERLLGAGAESVRGQSFAEVLAPADLERASAIFQDVLRGEAQEYELTLRTPLGREIDIRGVSIPIMEEGEVVGVFGVALDTTEAARAKQELELQRRYFADLFENSPEGIVLVEAETDRVLRVNAEFTRMFGYTSEEAVGRDLNDLIVPEDLTAEGFGLNAAARGGGRIKTETVRCRKDGSTVEVSVLARKLTLPGQSEELYGVYRDISDRKETERRLRQREEELRHAQKLEAVGKLAGGVAHDFNNLLTVINGHARFALENLNDAEALEDDLLEIEKAGVRAASLTQQLLAYSRRQVLHPQLLDLNAVVLEVQGMLRRLIGEHIRGETDLTQEDVQVRADRGRLEQVLVNLVVNARDAMPEGGTLRLETDVMELEPGDHRLDAWEVSPGPYVVIRVADTGTGMDEATLDRAFEPFFTTKKPGKGTGLGLATVFGIVKQSGGHVVASSEPGRGTTCEVLLPRIRTASPEEPAEVNELPEIGATGTILVVEDEAAVRNLVVRVLEREGCTVFSAENGACALDLMTDYEGKLDLVITDLVMPDMGGREMAARLRESHPDVPVLFMSGYEEDLVSGVEVGQVFLSKPFTPAALAERVSEVLSDRDRQGPPGRGRTA